MVEKDSKRREVLKMAKWNYKAILNAVRENLMRMIAKSKKAKEIAKYHSTGELIVEEGYPWGVAFGVPKITEFAKIGCSGKLPSYETCIHHIRNAVRPLEEEGIKVRRKGKVLYFWFTADTLVKWV